MTRDSETNIPSDLWVQEEASEKIQTIDYSWIDRQKMDRSYPHLLHEGLDLFFLSSIEYHLDLISLPDR